MAGAVLERKLSTSRRSGVEFSLATPTDDSEIRRLLRESAMPGRISISLEREPDYFAETRSTAGTKETIVARERGRVVCVGNCAVRARFVNGAVRQVGYLGGLRLDSASAGRFEILRRGYDFFRELQSASPADYYFTSIAADNVPARRFLERGVRGMPKYEFLGEFVTLILPVGRAVRHGSVLEPPAGVPEELVEFLHRGNARYQLAPRWTVEELKGLSQLGWAGDFQVIRREGRIVACASLWDQRSFKQSVIRGYAPGLARWRLAHNFIAPILGSPRLPAVGAVVASAFVSHLTAVDGDPRSIVSLIARLRDVASVERPDLQMLTLGFAANDPRLEFMRKRFRHREYRSRLYLVRWPEIGGAAEKLNPLVIAPEVALL